MGPPTACHACADVLNGNWVGTSTIPAHGLYPHQWSWDTAFISYGHAIMNASRARIEMEALFDGQWRNGLLPHIVFNPAVPDSAYFPGADYWRSSANSSGEAPAAPETSGIVNPPVHTSAVLNLLRRDPSAETRAFASRMYAPLTRWMDYLRTERDPDGNGLVYIRHPWESGMDNAATWDAILEGIVVPPGSIPAYHRTDLNHSDPADRPSNATYDRFVYLMICARNFSYSEAAISGRGGCPFLVEDVLFNTLYIQGAADLAELALLTGHAADAPRWRAVAKRAMASLSAQRWQANLSMFSDWDMRGGSPILVRSVGGLAPLLLPNATLAAIGSSAAESRRDALLATLRTSPGYKSAVHGVPSLDPLDPRFSPRLYWRGPAWFNIDWLLLQGLLGGGTPAAAAASREESESEHAADELKARLLKTMSELVERHGAREYWDPFTGEPHGTTSFSWTAALYLDAFCAGEEDPIRSGLLSRDS
jgi:hypothetical protein